MSREEREELALSAVSSPVEWHGREPRFSIIDGPLPNGRRFAYPLSILIEYDDDEVIVSEPRFHMHASAPTEAEAIAAFRRIFSGYLDILASQEEMLGARMREQLQYLRSTIKTS